MRRIVVIGTTGSGKTTFAATLAYLLGVPHIELDVLNWNPNWIETPTRTFLEKVDVATRSDGWVVDGNYSKARSIVWPRADMIIWLDFPFHVVMCRLMYRTTRRLLLGESCCNGNRESLRKVFSKNSIILWGFRSHWYYRRIYKKVLNDPQYASMNKIKFRSNVEAEIWLEQIRNHKNKQTPRSGAVR